MICWMNDQFLEEKDLRISPYDHGFLYGLGFFETFRTYGGEIPFLPEHYQRLVAALTEYRIRIPFTEQQLRTIVSKLIEQNGGKDGYFRVNVSAGEADIGLSPTFYDNPNAIVFQKPLVVSNRGTEKKGYWLSTPRNSPEGLERAKGHSYGNNVLARFELPSLAQTEGFFVTRVGLVAEGITSNMFWVKKGILYTPSTSTGILNGITRSQVLELAKELDIPVHEGEFYVEDVEAAEELFITNAVQELVPISHIGDVKFAGAMGRYYDRLHKAYVYVIQQRIEGVK
ncbi:MAG: aminodeoxychorismate lyase [Lysinibacillus sp.]